MGLAVTTTATCTCSFGSAPSNLMVIPQAMVNIQNKPTATIMDNKPMVNIMPFGTCSSMANPQVASATAAAMGVLTPQPCVPMTAAAPWMPGSMTTLIKGNPALTDSSKLMCNWGGVISITNPGSTTAQVK